MSADAPKKKRDWKAIAGNLAVILSVGVIFVMAEWRVGNAEVKADLLAKHRALTWYNCLDFRQQQKDAKRSGNPMEEDDTFRRQDAECQSAEKWMMGELYEKYAELQADISAPRWRDPEDANLDDLEDDEGVDI